MRPLEDRVALVAGATRGGGRGIARALGEAGATVYCTGRSTVGRGATPGRPETIEETARLVTEAGGEGIAVRADHTDAREVEAAFARVREEQGRLDVLVDSVWGGDALTQWDAPFWELDVEKARTVLRQAFESHVLTARYGAPLMVEQGRGLIVQVTDGDGYYYRGNLVYDLVKTGLIRMAFDLAQDLRDKGVASVAVTPGFLRSEAMLDHFGVTRETWREAAKQDANFLASETPLFVGRAVAALAADPDIMRRTGRVFASWTLSDEYGFVDEDGARPHWGRHFREKYGDAQPALDDAFYAYWTRMWLTQSGTPQG